RRPAALSGGERQRVALGRAIARSPRLVLLDEPFANLDAVLRVKLRREVFQLLRDRGIASLLVTHDQDEAADVADRMAVLDQGRLLQTGNPEDIRRRPASKAVAGFVGNSSLIEVSIESGVAQLQSRTMPLSGERPDGHSTAVLQPEDLALTDHEAPDLMGHAVRVETLGGSPVLVVETEGLHGPERLRVALGPTPPPDEGSPVGVRIRTPALYILP
ncbi:MAG TPA: ABC transporter ATP-binding protein, partial [Deltaproteobacteria bacterium]|nr:ABC transporter ATP-binding protein [Deltaproteobacteria bacterium]